MQTIGCVCVRACSVGRVWGESLQEKESGALAPQGVLGKKAQIKWRTFAAPLQCPKTGHGWTPAVNRPLSPSLSLSPPLSISLFLCGHVQLTPLPICPLPPPCMQPRAGTQALLTPRVLEERRSKVMPQQLCLQPSSTSAIRLTLGAVHVHVFLLKCLPIFFPFTFSNSFPTITVKYEKKKRNKLQNYDLNGTRSSSRANIF